MRTAKCQAKLSAHQLRCMLIRHSLPTVGGPTSGNDVLELVPRYLFKGSCARFQALTDTTLCKNIHKSITKRDSSDVSATSVSRKVLACIFIDTHAQSG